MGQSGDSDRYKSLTDQQLVQMAAQGDEGARAALVERYRPFCASLAWKSLPVLGMETDDVIQNVLLHMLRKLHHYDCSRGKFSTWLAAVARNRIIDLIRGVRSDAENLEQEPVGGMESLALVSGGTGPTQKASMKEYEAALMSCMEKLPPDLLEVIIGRYFEYRRTTDFEVSPSTISRREFRALKQLKECLYRKGFGGAP